MDQDQIREFVKSIESISQLLPPIYNIHSLIDDTGGQGIVYKGFYNGIESAIKVYYPNFHEVRVKREIESMQLITCDNMVRFIAYDELQFQETRLPVVVTEFIKGDVLSKVIREKKKFSIPQVAKLSHDVANAIDAMWEYEIVHRDIKPSNIILRPNFSACVIDLGVARHIGQTTLTQIHRATLGTPGYLSPEQAQGKHALTCKSDIFALGLLFVVLYLGYHPTVQNQQRLLNFDWIVNLPNEIKNWAHFNFLMKMLSSEPAHRPLPQTVIAEFGKYI